MGEMTQIDAVTPYLQLCHQRYVICVGSIIGIITIIELVLYGNSEKHCGGAITMPLDKGLK